VPRTQCAIIHPARVCCAKPESRADDVAVVMATWPALHELERVGDLIGRYDGSLALGRPPPGAQQRMARSARCRRRQRLSRRCRRASSGCRVAVRPAAGEAPPGEHPAQLRGRHRRARIRRRRMFGVTTTVATAVRLRSQTCYKLTEYGCLQGLSHAPEWWARTTTSYALTRPSTWDDGCRCVQERPNHPNCADCWTDWTHWTGWTLSKCCHGTTGLGLVERAAPSGHVVIPWGGGEVSAILLARGVLRLGSQRFGEDAFDASGRAAPRWVRAIVLSLAPGRCSLRAERRQATGVSLSGGSYERPRRRWRSVRS